MHSASSKHKVGPRPGEKDQEKHFKEEGKGQGGKRVIRILDTFLKKVTS